MLPYIFVYTASHFVRTSAAFDTPLASLIVALLLLQNRENTMDGNTDDVTIVDAPSFVALSSTSHDTPSDYPILRVVVVVAIATGGGG